MDKTLNGTERRLGQNIEDGKRRSDFHFPAGSWVKEISTKDMLDQLAHGQGYGRGRAHGKGMIHTVLHIFFSWRRTGTWTYSRRAHRHGNQCILYTVFITFSILFPLVIIFHSSLCLIRRLLLLTLFLFDFLSFDVFLLLAFFTLTFCRWTHQSTPYGFKTIFEFGFEFAELFEFASCSPGEVTLQARIIQSALNKSLIPLYPYPYPKIIELQYCICRLLS
jgi:hypothetical protein